MITIAFTDSEISELNCERYPSSASLTSTQDGSIVFKGDGNGPSRDFPADANLRQHAPKILSGVPRGGVDRLRRFDSGGSTCALDPHADTLARYFTLHPPHTVAETIERLAGIRRGETQVPEFLKKIGLKRRRTGSLQAKADPDAQEQLKKTSCRPG